MQIYYPSLQAIEQHTQQLDMARCAHCSQVRQLVSHGFIHKKRVGAEPEAVGKRVFCSNRNRRKGCGRTMQLYLDVTIRYLHYAGSIVLAFVMLLMAGASIASAYQHATGAPTPRHAYRWLNALSAQLSTYRSLSHRPLFHGHDGIQNAANATHDAVPHLPTPASPRPTRLLLLMASIKALLAQFAYCNQPLCAAYQQQLQRPFL